MATAANTLNFKQDIIEAAAQTVLAPFNLNKSFYNDIIKKVKSFAKEYSKSDQVKLLKQNISSIITDIVKTVIPSKIEQPLSVEPIKNKSINVPEFVKEKIPLETEQTNTNLSSKKEQKSFFESLRKILLEGFNQNSKKTKKETTEQKYFSTAQPVFLQEIAPDIYDKFSKIVENSIPDTKEKKEEKETVRQKYKEGGLLGLLPQGLLSGLLPILGGATLILGGLAALVGAFMTQGPAKGTLELIGKVGLKGGLTMVAKKIFTKSLEKVLGKIPIIGALISLGFAIQRFTNGDIVGGVLSLASGIASIFPGVGTAISIGIDVLQAILDAKAGGSSAEASAKKSGILLEWAKGLGSLIWKALRYAPIIGPLFDVYDSYEKGDWAGVAVNLLRSVGQMSGVFYVIDLIDTLTGGNLKSMAKEGMPTIGNWLVKLGDWLQENARDWPIIGRLVKIGEAIGSNNWAEALTQFTRIIPGTGWLLDWLGMTEEKQTQAYQQGGNMLADLWDWMKTTMWEKVTGFMGGLIDGVKDWWNNLSWDPKSWIGMAPETPSGAKATVKVNGKEMSLDEYKTSQKTANIKSSINVPTPMADGGIVTQPTTALIGEAGPEAVVPLDKYMGPTGGLDDSIFKKIAANTGSTNDGLKSLSQAIFKLAQIYDKNSKSNTNNIVVNGQKQQERVASASEVAASNRDPIRQVRMQFAI